MVAPVIRFCGISSPGSHEELPEKAEIQLPHIAIIVLVGSVAGGTASNVVSYLA